MENYLVAALQRKIRRDLAKDDIEYFAKYYLPHIVEDRIPAFHKEIYRMVEEYKRLCIAAPRGFAKSTIVQIIYGMHCLLFNEREDILVISASASLSEDWLRKIKNELDNNDRIKEDFGSLLEWGEKRSKRWTNTHLVIQKNGRVFSQVRARGRGCQVRGLRPTKVFCDDLEDEELVRSGEQRKQLREWFLGALINVLKVDQQLILIGTVLHQKSLIQEILTAEKEFQAWETKKYTALNDNRGKLESLWSARFPVKDLLQRKAEIGTYAFESEFMNNPISSDVCLWKPEWIQTFKRLPRIRETYVALDPAASEKEKADYSALIAMGVGEDGGIYEIESERGHWGTWDLIDHCIKFNEKHRPIRFGVEEVSFQNFIRPILIPESIKRTGHRIPVQGIKVGQVRRMDKEKKSPRDKFTRALAIIHLFEQRAVYLRTSELIDEVATFPTGDHDDLVDAMVYTLWLITRYTPGEVFTKQEAVRNPLNAEKTFEMPENRKIPCFSSVKDLFKGKKDWRIG